MTFTQKVDRLPGRLGGSYRVRRSLVFCVSTANLLAVSEDPSVQQLPYDSTHLDFLRAA